MGEHGGGYMAPGNPHCIYTDAGKIMLSLSYDVPFTLPHLLSQCYTPWHLPLRINILPVSMAISMIDAPYLKQNHRPIWRSRPMPFHYQQLNQVRLRILASLDVTFAISHHRRVQRSRTGDTGRAANRDIFKYEAGAWWSGSPPSSQRVMSNMLMILVTAPSA